MKYSHSRALKIKKTYRNNPETKHLIFTYFFKRSVKKIKIIMKNY